VEVVEDISRDERSEVRQAMGWLADLGQYE
jgi:hypothetical protein